MAGWKTSDGGSIAPIGAEQFTGTISLGVELVSALANVDGVILRTAVLRNVSAVDGSLVFNRYGNDVVLLYQQGIGVSVFPRELFIPPGVSLAAFSNSTDAFGDFTWDVL